LGGGAVQPASLTRATARGSVRSVNGAADGVTVLAAGTDRRAKSFGARPMPTNTPINWARKVLRELSVLTGINVSS
jgi:hypothetical protein